MARPTLALRSRTGAAAMALTAATVVGLAALVGERAPRGAGAPRWIALERAAGVARASVRGLAPVSLALGDGRAVELARDAEGTWLSVALARAAWRETLRPGLWRATPPINGLGPPRMRLVGGGRSFVPCRWSDADASGDVPPGSFSTIRGELYLRIEPGAAPPADLVLSVKVERESAGGEVLGRRFSGRGLSVWPGQTVELVVDAPPRSALRFATSAESALTEGVAAEVSFRVELDGVLLLRESMRVGPDGSFAWHEVALPARGVRRARLTFAVEGPFAYTSFLEPVIGPLDVGSYGERPGEHAPDLIVFLADTFRADNLAAYGGRPGLTPALDAFAEESVRFERAWSVGTFTLPAHASMFSGLFPRQTSADGLLRALPGEIETIAERLSRAGYRTGAITDSGVVSLRFGLHQGFGFFDELCSGLDSTLERARAFLAADDGRPVFLFVQTYRVHTPFAAGADAQSELAELGLTVDLDFHAAYARWRASRDAGDAAAEREAAEALRTLYLGGVRDLDRGFERFLGDLEALGLSDVATLVFTSDHGEAFLEHDEMFHEGRVFEEQVRIPLLVHAPGLAPRSVPHAASLIDFAPTLAGLAGIPADPRWPGQSWLTLERDRPVFAFECASGDRRSTVALIDGRKKLIALEGAAPGQPRLEPWRAFDLEIDPSERDDRLAGDRAWPVELQRRLAPLVEPLLLPALGPEPALLDEEKVLELEALGYLGAE